MAFRRSTVRSRSAPPIIPRESEIRFAGNYGLGRGLPKNRLLTSGSQRGLHVALLYRALLAAEIFDVTYQRCISTWSLHARIGCTPHELVVWQTTEFSGIGQPSQICKAVPGKVFSRTNPLQPEPRRPLANRACHDQERRPGKPPSRRSPR